MQQGAGLVFKRILLKMSGEALMGKGSYAIDTKTVSRIVQEVVQIHQLGVQVAIVIGGGNFFVVRHCLSWVSIGLPVITWECLPL